MGYTKVSPIADKTISGSWYTLTSKLNIVGKRWRYNIPKLIIAPAVGDGGDGIFKFIYIGKSDELHACLFEVGQPLEVVREVAAHLEDTDAFSLNLDRFCEVFLSDRYTLEDRWLWE